MNLKFFFLVFVFIFVGCQDNAPKQQQQTAPTKPPLTLKVVVNDALITPYEKLFPLFQKKYAPTRVVNIERTTLSGFADAQEIASGEQKNDLWVGPSLFAPQWTNENLVNLGAKQIGCESYGSSPLGLITTIDIVSKVCDQESGCLWEALANFLSDRDSAPPKGFQRSLLVTPPLRGPVESISWASLFHWEGVDIFRPFEEQPKATSARWSDLNLIVLPNNDGVFSRIANSDPLEQYITVAPIADLKLFQRANPGEASKRLIPLPLRETESFTSEFALCTSSADWVTPDKHVVIKELRKFLSSNEAKAILSGFGYEQDSSKPKEDTEDKEKVNPKISITDPKIRTFVSDSWGAFREPVALTIAMDTSASLEEEGRIHDVKRVMRLLVASEPEDSTIALMTYSSKPNVEAKFGTSRKQILKKIDRATPIGGSAVYDALVAAFELTERAPEDTMRRLLFITDGGDINSRLHQDQIMLMAKRRAEWREVDLLVIGLKTKGGKLKDIKEIAKAANGRYIETTSLKLSELLTTLQSQ